MLVHRRATPQQYVAGTHLYTWVERDNVGQSVLSKETTRWQGLGVKPPTFRSEVQHAIDAKHYTTAPPLCPPCEAHILKLELCPRGLQLTFSRPTSDYDIKIPAVRKQKQNNKIGRNEIMYSY